MDFALPSPVSASNLPPVVSSAAQPRRHRFTRAEYANLMPDNGRPRPRTELIAGEIVDMSPQGNRHANVVAVLTYMVGAAVDSRLSVRAQLPMGLTDDTEPEPDLCVAPWPEDVDSDHPATALLVIEVAHSSIDYDREVKLRLYAAAHVPEYWIVDIAAQQVEVYCDPQGTTYASKRTCRTGEVIQSTAIAALAVPVAAIFLARPG